jgi:hypothetical protein
MAIRPQMISSFHEGISLIATSGANPIESQIQVYHLSQNVLEIMFKPPSNSQKTGIDLMVLLRT